MWRGIDGGRCWVRVCLAVVDELGESGDGMRESGGLKRKNLQLAVYLSI